MPVVFDLNRRVYAERDGNLLLLAAGAAYAERHVLARPDLDAIEADDIENLRAVEAQRLGVRVLLELQGEHAHADEVRAVYALEALGDDGAHTQQERPLRRPVARTAGSVLLPGDDDQRKPRRLVVHRRVVDAHLLADGLQSSDAAFGARHHQILDADVGERTAHHHLMVAAARAVGVEVLHLDAPKQKIATGGRLGLDRARGADVVGRHRGGEDCGRAWDAAVGNGAGLP